MSKWLDWDKAIHTVLVGALTSLVSGIILSGLGFVFLTIWDLKSENSQLKADLAISNARIAAIKTVIPEQLAVLDARLDSMVARLELKSTRKVQPQEDSQEDTEPLDQMQDQDFQGVLEELQRLEKLPNHQDLYEQRVQKQLQVQEDLVK